MGAGAVYRETGGIGKHQTVHEEMAWTQKRTRPVRGASVERLRWDYSKITPPESTGSTAGCGKIGSGSCWRRKKPWPSWPVVVGTMMPWKVGFRTMGLAPGVTGCASVRVKPPLIRPVSVAIFRVVSVGPEAAMVRLFPGISETRRSAREGGPPRPASKKARPALLATAGVGLPSTIALLAGGHSVRP